MRAIRLLIAILLLSACCYGQTSTSVTNVSTVRVRGRSSTPSLSTSGNAVFYFDTSSGKLKVSQNGAAYADLVTTVSLPVADTTSVVEGSADGSKEIRFEVDGLSASTVRVITAPDSNTTLPIISQIVTIAGPTAARTYTFPDAAATIARTDAGQTFTGVNIFTSPKILTDISDTNGNELIKFTATGSAVNEVTITNAATTAAPIISFTGEANVSGKIFITGTGELFLGSASGPSASACASGCVTVRSALSDNNALQTMAGFYKASSKGPGLKIEAHDTQARIGANWLTSTTNIDLVLGGIAGVTDRNNLLLGSAGDVTVQNALANGQNLKIDSVTENTTLSTGGATTDTTIQLPANAFIVSVTGRITTTIAGVDSTSVQLGTSAVAARFGSMSALSAGTTTIGLNHLQGSISADNAGPVQTSAAAVRITLSGGGDNTPSAGVVRVTIHYITLTAPTS